MSEQLTLPAEARDRAGKGASRALRREGRVPAVVYGEKKEPLSIHVEEKLLSKMLSTGHFMNSVVMIDFQGKPHRTLPKAVDFHPVTSRPMHVDFLRISEHTKVHVNVPVRFDNEEAFAGSEARRRSQRRHARARDGLRRGEHPERDPRAARWARDRRFAAHQPGEAARRVIPANTDEDFTVATIVAPSAMKSEEEEAAPAGEVPTVRRARQARPTRTAKTRAGEVSRFREL